MFSHPNRYSHVPQLRYETMSHNVETQGEAILHQSILPS